MRSSSTFAKQSSRRHPAAAGRSFAFTVASDLGIWAPMYALCTVEARQNQKPEGGGRR
jgi:hypothetical protein